MRTTVTGPKSADIARGQEEDLARIQTATVREATTLFRDDVRQETRQAFIGRKDFRNRLPMAWRMRAYPEAGASLDPAGWVYVRGPRPGSGSNATSAATLIDAFQRGVTIGARRGGWLAVPTDAAGQRAPTLGAAKVGRFSQTERITPAGFERRSGMKLRFVPASPGKALLVVDSAKRDRLQRAVPYGKGRGSKLYGPAGHTIVVFTLLRQVRLPKRLDFTKAEKAADLRWNSLLSKNWR